MFGQRAATATDRRVSTRVPFGLITAFTAAALLGIGAAGAAAQKTGLPPSAGVPVVLEGELEVLYEDHEDRAELVHFLHANKGRIRVRFQGGFAPDLMTGSRVRVRGDLADGTMTATDVEVLAASTSWTMGSKKVLVILFNFSNNTLQPWAMSTVTSINDKVRDYYLENTYNQTHLSFTVAGWYTIAATDANCDYYTWASQAEAAATNAGIDVKAYDRRVLAFPKASSCGWAGAGNVGGPRSWLNGTYTVRTTAHEQGHNFGLSVDGPFRFEELAVQEQQGKNA